MLRITRLSADAVLPTRGSTEAAGADLSSVSDFKIPPRGRTLVSTGLQIVVPSGCYGRIAGRSGLAWKNGIFVFSGVLDADYRGTVFVLLYNSSDEEYIGRKGDRIAQLICERIVYPDIIEDGPSEPTARGAGGFGSTGVGMANSERSDSTQSSIPD